MSIRHKVHDAIFRRVHSSTLIYNTCWEDPRLDRKMLDLKDQSRVVMITSAGCNALDYLLDGPAQIHAVDMNPRQNALLQLKLAVIERCDHAELFRLFGEGKHPGFRQMLRDLAPGMHPYARTFWQAKHKYFEPTGVRPSFYYRGAAGHIAWIALQSLVRNNRQVREFTQNLINAQDEEQQQRLYRQLHPALWNAFNSWLVRQPLTMAMLGVPRAQIRLIEHQFPGGIAGYIQRKMEHVFTKLPMRDNYFWRVYATGGYTSDCCPNYLRPENHATLRARAARVLTHTMTVSNFLQRNPGVYSHYVLLDHQDWLAAHQPEALNEEWDLILANSKSGTKILMRSASPEIDFIPPHAKERLRLFPEIASSLHQLDRVGTYGSTLLAEVR